MHRERVRVSIDEGGAYFASPKSSIDFIGTGCKPFDLALGGGWAESRIFNVVGDKSTGKTLLMIEASANFVRKHRKKHKGKLVRYREAESAFDPPYAEALGMPLDAIDFGGIDKPFETVEDMFEDLLKVVEGARGPELYIVDSLDALSDRAEMDRGMDEGTYGTAKAKLMSQLFRRLVRALANKQVTVGIVSQVRDNIGVTFGRTTTRSGGRALDFYASQVVFLAQLGLTPQTRNGVQRPVGVNIKAKVDKNKVSLPFREAEFNIRFGYGIDDMQACLKWLKEVKQLEAAHGGPIDDIWPKSSVAAPGKAASDGLTVTLNKMNDWSDDVYFAELERIRMVVQEQWYTIEKSFLPERRKYPK